MPTRPAYTDSPEGALQALEDLCDQRIVIPLKERIAAGTLEWVADPDHRHVWGVREQGVEFQRGKALKVVLIVYTDEGDFELDDEWWFG